MVFYRYLALCLSLVISSCTPEHTKNCSALPRQESPELLTTAWKQMVPLKGGLSESTLFLVSDDAQEYVIRHIAHRNSQDKIREIQAQLVASEGGYGPQMFAYDLDTGIILMQYLKPSTASVSQDILPQKYAQLLHQIQGGPSYCDGLSITDQINNRFKQIKLYPKSTNLPQIETLLSRLIEIKVKKKTPSHRDLNPNNIIWQGDTFKIIDFENAAQDDPFFDVATISLFNFHTPESKQRFFEAYLKRHPTSQEQEHLEQMHKTVCLYYGLELLYHLPEDIILNSKNTSLTLMQILPALSNGSLSLNSPHVKLILAQAFLNEAINN